MKCYLNNQTCKKQLSHSPPVRRQEKSFNLPWKVAFCPANPFIFAASRESLLVVGDNSYGDLDSRNWRFPFSWPYVQFLLCWTGYSSLMNQSRQETHSTLGSEEPFRWTLLPLSIFPLPTGLPWTGLFLDMTTAKPRNADLMTTGLVPAACPGNLGWAVELQDWQLWHDVTTTTVLPTHWLRLPKPFRPSCHCQEQCALFSRS